MTLSLAAQRQREALRRSDQVASLADRALSHWWGDLNAILQHGPRYGLPWTAALVRRHFEMMPQALADGLRAGLADLWRWGYASARGELLRTLPRAAVQRVVQRRMGYGTHNRMVGARDDVGARGYARLPEYRSRSIGGGGVGTAVLTEDRSALDALFSIAQPLRYDSPRLFAPLFGDLSDDESRSLLADFILPPPSEEKVRQHVERLIQPFLVQPRADLVPPQRLADVVIQQYAVGATRQEIEKALAPHVNGIAASARRVSRTWGTYVANATQMEATERLSDVVIGYTIRSAKKSTSRPAHVRRDGTQYFREPGPGQLGFDAMPRPPLEADGSVAWNCMCWLEVILSPVGD